MNLGHLAVFHAVAREGNVSRAAEAMAVSQPAMSKQLKQLERSVGAALFDRMPKGMRLTAAGETLAGYARRIFGLEAEAEQAMGALRGLRRGTLSIGASTTIGVYLLPEVFVKFRQKHPGVQVRLEIGTSDVIAKRLVEGEVQLGFTESEVMAPELLWDVFAEDRLVAIAPPTHPLARRRRVTAHALCAEPFVVRETGSGSKSLVERTLAELGLAVNAVMSLGSTEAIKRAVAGGVGVAIVSKLSIALEVKAGRLAQLNVRDLKIRRPLYRVRPRDHAASAAERAFMELFSAQDCRRWTVDDPAARRKLRP